MRNDSSISIYSNLQVFIITLLGGPLAGSFLLSRNYDNAGQKKTAIQIKWTGFIFMIIVMAVAVFFSAEFLQTEGTFFEEGQRSIIGMILLLVALHFVVAMIYWWRREKLNISSEQLADTCKLKKNPIIYVIPYFLMGVGVNGYFLFSGPFWFIFTLIYFLPNVYLHNHIKKVFATTHHKKLFTAFFFLLVILFPIGEALEHSSGNGLAGILLWIGYLYLPLLLYMLLFYLVFDLVNLFNHLFNQNRPSRKFRIGALGFILIVAIGITGKGLYNFNHTEINTYQIEVPGKNSKLNSLTMALAADFHFSERTSKKFVRQFVDKMNSIEPDIILLPGDLIETLPGEQKTAFIQSQLRKLQATYGIYAVEGNHELYGDNGKLEFFRNTGIHFLKDTVNRFEDVFYLVGRKDRHNRDRKSLDQLLKSTNSNLPTIVMDHQPYYLNKAANHDIDIQVSGHTHHGQMFPFHWITEAIYELSWGHKVIQNTHFFVTCGAQGWGPPVKTSSRSEIMEIDVRFTE
jgi:predicted MPP superfamily phosphohydrolase